KLVGASGERNRKLRGAVLRERSGALAAEAGPRNLIAARFAFQRFPCTEAGRGARQTDLPFDPAIGGQKSVFKGIRKSCRFWVAIVGVFGESPFDDLGELGGDIATRGSLAWIGGGHREMHHHDLGGRFALEGESPREQLKKNHPHGVEVAAPVDLVPPPLLGGHVIGCAAHDTRTSYACFGRVG